MAKACALVLLGALSSVGCAAAESTPAAQTPAPVRIACPALSPGQRDLAQVFGVDAQLAARLERTLLFAQTLQKTATELSQQASATCQALTLDLQGSVAAGEHPCTALGKRVQQLKQTLGSGGFSVRVSGLSCSVPTDAMASCAGECLTGESDVVSAVSCATGAAGCALDFSMPNAGSECAAECAASALSRASCSAEVEVKLGSATVTAPEYAAMASALERDLPRLFGLASSIAPRSAALASQTVDVIDDVAASIDALSHAKPSLDRRAIAGIVLAGCVAPQLAGVLQQAESLKVALSAAADAQTAFR